MSQFSRQVCLEAPGMVFVRAALVSLVITISLIPTPVLGDSTAKIEPLLRPRQMQTVQPYAGEARFVGTPGYERACSLAVSLVSLRRLEGTEQFRLEKAGVYGFIVSPDSVSWSGPIDSSSSKDFLFTFRPEQVGTHQFILQRRLKSNWQTLASLILAINEDGGTAFAGAAADHQLTLVPPHPKRDVTPPIIRFPLRGDRFDPEVDKHFTAEFRFSRPPAVNETTFVDFTLNCQFDLYSQIQFVLDYSTNLKASSLPRSWGDSAKPTEELRYYRGKFWFVPIKPGLGVLTYKIIGKRPFMKHSDRITTDFPIYFVIGDDNEFLFLGDFDPFTRFKVKGDPMIGAAAGLLRVQNLDYKLRQLLSQPDYLGEEIKMRENADTASSRK